VESPKTTCIISKAFKIGNQIYEKGMRGSLSFKDGVHTISFYGGVLKLDIDSKDFTPEYFFVPENG